MDKTFLFKTADLGRNSAYLNEYINTLSYPMESYMEENLEQAELYSIYASDLHIGFAAKKEETLWCFYLQRPWLSFAQVIFNRFIEIYGIKSVIFQTSDALLSGLVSDWEFKKEKTGYIFIDNGRKEKPAGFIDEAFFRTACKADMGIIEQETGDFFDSLERRIEQDTIFMLLAGDTLLGCGIIEYGRYFKKNASIGMITGKAHRKKGVAQTILWHLKDLCRQKGLIPVAGCWYYNTLSRKTMEKADMVPIGRHITAHLTGREEIPERTGNPPGEAVESKRKDTAIFSKEQLLDT